MKTISVLQIFGKKKKVQQEEEDEEIEEPNLYGLIEQLIVEKQEMRNQMTRMEQEIGLLREEIKGLKERNPSHG